MVTNKIRSEHGKYEKNILPFLKATKLDQKISWDLRYDSNYETAQCPPCLPYIYLYKIKS